MRSVRILSQAAEEAVEAAAWYDAESPPLGKEFAAVIEAAIGLIEENILPLLPMPGDAGAQGAKRIILKRFPYHIVVIEKPTETLVVAIAHHSRKPGYWRGRLEG